MPDWSYRPIFRPLLFKVPPERARKITLSALAALAATPLGPELIDFMGHLAPSPALARDVAGMTFGSPVGLGAGLDVDARATKALERFGFGFIEIGPVTIEPVPSPGKVERLGELEAIRYRGPGETVDLPSLVKRLDRYAPSRLPLAIRLASLPDSDLDAATAQCIQLVNALQGHAAFWTLGAGLDFDQRGWPAALLLEHLAAVLRAIQTHPMPRPLFLCLPPDIDHPQIDALIEPAMAFGLAGVSITGGIRSDTPCDRLVGMPTRLASLKTVRAIRTRVGSRVAIIGSGGVLQPADALLLLHAGADLVQVHSGLVFSGPGLPKRINDAVEALEIDRRRDGENQSAGEESSRGVAQTRHRSIQGTGSTGSTTAPGGIGARRIAASIVHDKAPGWLYGTLYGIGIAICGCVAWFVASTRVVLPYDEHFVGLSRSQLAAVNPRLLPFMTHDRVTLAGTMISIGVLYSSLAYFGMHQGEHWARHIVAISSAVGFSSFFLWVGFGYFDPLHAVISVGLLPLFLLCLRRPLLPRMITRPTVNLSNDPRWLAGLYGQLIFVALGAGLILAGSAIAVIGVTSVFVPSDLAFMGASRQALRAVTPRLISLVAHDRAGFGGALVADGLALITTVLWGFRAGARWLWWTLLVAGLAGFASTLGVHLRVGYTDFEHLAPVIVGSHLFVIGLVLSFPYLCMRGPTTDLSLLQQSAINSSAPMS